MYGNNQYYGQAPPQYGGGPPPYGGGAPPYAGGPPIYGGGPPPYGGGAPPYGGGAPFGGCPPQSPYGGAGGAPFGAGRGPLISPPRKPVKEEDEMCGMCCCEFPVYVGRQTSGVVLFIFNVLLCLFGTGVIIYALLSKGLLSLAGAGLVLTFHLIVGSVFACLGCLGCFSPWQPGCYTLLWVLAIILLSGCLVFTNKVSHTLHDDSKLFQLGSLNEYVYSTMRNGLYKSLDNNVCEFDDHSRLLADDISTLPDAPRVNCNVTDFNIVLKNWLDDANVIENSIDTTNLCNSREVGGLAKSRFWCRVMPVIRRDWSSIVSSLSAMIVTSIATLSFLIIVVICFMCFEETPKPKPKPTRPYQTPPGSLSGMGQRW